jgi:hypothetical protein
LAAIKEGLLMAFIYGTYGPFELKREGPYVSRDLLRDFWDDEVNDVGLENGIGVYLLTVRHGNSVKPWYVGKTDASFQKRLREHADSHKLFPGLAEVAPKGRVELMFLALRTKDGKGFRKPSDRSSANIKTLERLLIGSCVAKNSHLLNVQHMSVYKALRVPGYMNEGKGNPGASASSLKSLLG